MDFNSKITKQLNHISALTFTHESYILYEALSLTKSLEKNRDEIKKIAKNYIQRISKQKKTNNFIKKFGLNSEESISLMCLAEALLRIPDKKSINDLINDKLKNKDWKKFLHKNQGFINNPQIWALTVSSQIIKMENSQNIVKRSLQYLTKPTIRIALKTAITILSKEFISGQNLENALHNIKAKKRQGYMFSFDMLGEAARTKSQSDFFLDNYLTALQELHNSKVSNPNISVKLSALHPRYEYLQQKRAMEELYSNIKRIALTAQKYQIAISIDAEESFRLDSQLEIFSKLILDPKLKDFEGIGFVLQAYNKSAIAIIDLLVELAKISGKKISVRLVKGAYWDSEIKWAQMKGLESYPVFTKKSYTDVNYLACAKKLLDNSKYLFPQFATHNALTFAAITKLITKQQSYEFQCLYGMGEELYDEIVKNHPCRIYTPVGEYKDLLPYLIRRLIENGANSNFIYQLNNKKFTELLADPFVKSRKSLKEKKRKIPLPKKIFSNRLNSQGYYLANKFHLNILAKAQQKFTSKEYNAYPIIFGKKINNKAIKIYSPYDQNKFVGNIHLANQKTLLAALNNHNDIWENNHISQRARSLDKMAFLIKKHQEEFITLLAREAGKTLEDAISEIREAIDFCRYYAATARELLGEKNCETYSGEKNILSYQAKGVFACISPWNFPLAIYVGQIAAALVTGNKVIAKPSSLTTITASLTTKLFYQAGIPQDILQFTPSTGHDFERIILTSPKINGVVFTGSNQTANNINNVLATRKNSSIARLIAETGGQNVMIVDSSALLEQALDDIIMSSFGSAGQRCSSLRVLFVQEEIANQLINLIKGALQELIIGNPLNFATDMGPVISKQAKQSLESHIKFMHKNAKLIAEGKINKNCQNGYFVKPYCFEIPNISLLTSENFGPILHLIRYKSDNIDQVIHDINSTGYGLTFGIHSRINQHIDYLCQNIKAGNIYINRNITGAIVGSQPFGGMNLSGTGPKAGGENYLKAFMNEKTISNNITAIGGNLEILSKDSN